jgi:hypothetical protein
MSKKNVTPTAVDSNEMTNVFDGIKRTAETTIFESKAIKQKLLVGTDDEIKAVNKAHTLTIEFDFTGLTVDECVDQLVSTTSFMKLFQNNIIGNTDKRWTEQTILDTIAKGTYHVTCRSLLDDRTRREADPTTALKNAALKMKAKGLTNDQIMEQLLAKLNS